ncbi:MAG: diaminopropionate ammonia-lyase, partial [Pseudomonadota bacterium]
MTHDKHPNGHPATSQTTGIQVVENPATAARDAALPGPFTAEGFDAAFAEISTWPGYRATPLHALPALAGSLGVTAVHYKDEAGRFGLGSFKPLGGAYAVARALCRELERGGVAGARPSDLRTGRYADKVAAITLASATDGNHGRAVAWAAKLFGARAKIFSHDQMSEGRRAAIRDLGADLVICEGGYDDSVREAFAVAAQNGWPVVQDTSIGAYRRVPIDITHGYGVIAHEVVSALDSPPTHAIVQAGVGGVASAIAAQFWRFWGPQRPRFIVLEPTNAACVAQSLAAGAPVTIEGDT